jgi:putative transposase
MLAMNLAVAQHDPDGIIRHSDLGSQCTSVAFGRRCRGLGARSSLGPVGNCCDDAMCESFLAMLACESFDRRKFGAKVETRVDCFMCIEGWYNPSRSQSALGISHPSTTKGPSLRGWNPQAHNRPRKPGNSS